MKKEYPLKAICKNKKDLEKRLGNPQEDGTYLIVGSNDYIAFYNPKKNNIILEINKESIDEQVEAEMKFWKFIKKFLK